jgi:hypothetical protein
VDPKGIRHNVEGAPISASDGTADVTRYENVTQCDEYGHPAEYAASLTARLFNRLGLPARRPSCPAHQEDVGGVGSMPCMCKDSSHSATGLNANGTNPSGPT